MGSWLPIDRIDTRPLPIGDMMNSILSQTPHVPQRFAGSDPVLATF